LNRPKTPKNENGSPHNQKMERNAQNSAKSSPSSRFPYKFFEKKAKYQKFQGSFGWSCNASQNDGGYKNKFLKQYEFQEKAQIQSNPNVTLNDIKGILLPIEIKQFIHNRNKTVYSQTIYKVRLENSIYCILIL
jgi:hypothetical protein